MSESHCTDKKFYVTLEWPSKDIHHVYEIFYVADSSLLCDRLTTDYPNLSWWKLIPPGTMLTIILFSLIDYSQLLGHVIVPNVGRVRLSVTSELYDCPSRVATVSILYSPPDDNTAESAVSSIGKKDLHG